MPKTKAEAPTASQFDVVRMADRLFKMPREQRANAVEKAKARLNGDHPRARDAAIVKAFG
jgi:hypothetical protein